MSAAFIGLYAMCGMLGVWNIGAVGMWNGVCVVGIV